MRIELPIGKAIIAVPQVGCDDCICCGTDDACRMRGLICSAASRADGVPVIFKLVDYEEKEVSHEAVEHAAD